MAALTEYYVRYRYTGKSNTGAGSGAGQKSEVLRDRFAVSGNTGIQMGRITRIVFRHCHSSTRSCTWQLYGRLALQNRTLDSDIQAVRFDQDVPCFTNTFTENLPTPEEFETWTGIQTWAAAVNSASAQLYWRATSSQPMDLFVYFYDIRDLGESANPPEVTGIRLEDGGAGNPLGTFGYCVQGQSRPVITGLYRLDPDYPGLSADHTLKLYGPDGAELFAATQADDSAFDVGIIARAGEVRWRYTVLDIAGNEVSREGTFRVLPWSPPSLQGLRVERYAAAVDDEGGTVYIPADDGDRVRVSLSGSVAAVAGLNGWTLGVSYGPEGGSATTIQVASGADGGELAWTEDRDVLTGAIDSARAWSFTFTLSDSFSSATQTAYVDEAGACFDVERCGVAVGMRSTATEADRRFEVAEGYAARFYGGIEGVTNYAPGETATGGRWIDGKPVYRFVAVGQTALSGAQGTLARLTGAPDTVIDLRGTLRGTDGAWRPMPNALYSSANGALGLCLSGAEIVLSAGSAHGGIKDFVVTAEYTKAE